MRKARIAFLALVPALLPAQTAPRPLLETSGTFVGLSVGDIEASTKWYVEKLGLRVTHDFPRTDQTRAAARMLQGGGLSVELVQQDEAKALSAVLPAGRGALYLHGIFKFGVSVNDFDATLAAVRARGIEIAIGPFAKGADQPANMIIRDNSGNYIQISGKP